MVKSEFNKLPKYFSKLLLRQNRDLSDLKIDITLAILSGKIRALNEPLTTCFLVVKFVCLFIA